MRRVTQAIATAIAVTLSSGAALTAASADERGAGGGDLSARFVDNHGPVLPAVQLYLIYWGSAWTSHAARGADT